MAGYAGVMFAFGSERFSNTTFDPTFSILVVSMVVIGGLDSITGALLGAIYLIGLPAIFGANADDPVPDERARVARVRALPSGGDGRGPPPASATS